jgi:hypothetical protein
VEDVLAEDGEEASGFVHALQTYGAGGKLHEGGCRRGQGFGCEGGCKRWGLNRRDA